MKRDEIEKIKQEVYEEFWRTYYEGAERMIQGKLKDAGLTRYLSQLVAEDIVATIAFKENERDEEKKDLIFRERWEKGVPNA